MAEEKEKKIMEVCFPDENSPKEEKELAVKVIDNYLNEEKPNRTS